MSEDCYKKIFSKNLKHYMELSNKTQIDLIKDLNINKSAISTWCNGTRLPRMDKIDMLAKYFNINRSDLIEEHTTPPTRPTEEIPKNEIKNVRMATLYELRLIFSQADKNEYTREEIVNLLDKIAAAEEQ